MAVDMFLKIGAVKGEAQDGKHKEWIDVLSWSWGANQTGTGHLGGGAGTGKVSVNDLSITNFMDASSPDLWLACCKGTHYGEAKLKVRKAGDKPLEYLDHHHGRRDRSPRSRPAGPGVTSARRRTCRSTSPRSRSTTPRRTQKGGAAGQYKMGWDIAKNDNVVSRPTVARPAARRGPAGRPARAPAL